MASKFQIGKGTVVSISTNGTTFTPVSQAKTISFSGSKMDLDDITNMDSAGAYHEYAPTLLDAGQVSLQGVFDPDDAGQLSLHASFEAQTLLVVKVQFPKSSSQTSTGLLRTFSAYVTAHDIDVQFDKSSTFSSTLKITGGITNTDGN